MLYRQGEPAKQTSDARRIHALMHMCASTMPKQELPLTAQFHVLLQITVDRTSALTVANTVALTGADHSERGHQHLLLYLLLQITVDGDTSTNDTCIGLASGAAANDLIKHSTSEAAQKLEAAVTALLQVLPLPLPAHRCVI